MQTSHFNTGVEAFTAAASAYEAWFASPLGAFVDELETQALARILQGVGGASVVEIGAGTGHMSTCRPG